MVFQIFKSKSLFCFLKQKQRALDWQHRFSGLLVPSLALLVTLINKIFLEMPISLQNSEFAHFFDRKTDLHELEKI